MKKTTKIMIASAIAILLCFFCIGSLLLSAKENEPPEDYSTSQQIVIENGTMDQSIFELEIPVFEKGAYILHTEWENEQGGMITGVIFTAPDGTMEYAATADSCQADSSILQLQPGMYRLEIYSLLSQKELREFWTNMDSTLLMEDYSFVENATLQMNYTILLKKGSVFSLGEKCVILCGILLGLLMSYIFLVVTKKGDSTKAIYDERQQAVRGTGFKTGFFTMLGFDGFIALCLLLEIPIPADMEIIVSTGAIIGIGVYAVYCSWNDGYFALNENRNSILIFLGIIGLINLALAIVDMISNTLFQNGRLTFRGLNLLCGILVIVVFLTLLIKKAQDGKEEER
ncbi:MAG: hypothetical protein NC089_03970 [Bacteroides sp.]|nr:hypothetical protein [Bacteroides sp.]MCM1548551.1 hypothetical protein [Clostridium sp.]